MDPIIILCVPRSFSSVICAALGQHPQLYGFPELNLFVGDTIDDLLQLDAAHEQQTGVHYAYSAGLLRAVMHLLSNEEQPEDALQEAIEWVDKRRLWECKRVFSLLLNCVKPRIGVDKSTRTAMSRQSMKRVINMYPGSRFLHLTRNPVTNLQSLQQFWSCQSDALNSQVVQSSGLDLISYGAHFWCHFHQAIIDFTQNLPDGQSMMIRSESLLSNPVQNFTRIAEWLNLRSDFSAVDMMLHPENSPYVGIVPALQGCDNDPGFLKDPKLRSIDDACRLQVPQEWEVPSWLQSRMSDLTLAMGYP